MKASDFTTGRNDREKAMSNLLKTEKTDAVNTGLVEKADKSAKALKGDLYSVGKKGTHGAGSTALDAIARKRKKTSAADALDGKSRSQLTGKNALTKKVQSRHNLNKSLKRGAKGVAAKAAHNALKDSELEGTDDLVATTHTGAKTCRKRRESTFVPVRMHLKKKTLSVPSRKKNTAPRNWIKKLPRSGCSSPNTSIGTSTRMLRRKREEKGAHDSFRWHQGNAFIACRCRLPILSTHHCLHLGLRPDFRCRWRCSR